MLNKIFLTFLIFFYLIGNGVHSNEQISFDVNEIEILDDGNKVVGKNRGIITTENGITIEADEFEFNKIKNILQAKGNIIINDRVNNYNFTAQNIFYNRNEERLELIGQAEALVDSNYKFNSKNIFLSPCVILLTESKKSLEY